MYLLYVANVDCKSAFCLKIDHDNIKSIRSTNKHVQQQKNPYTNTYSEKVQLFIGEKEDFFFSDCKIYSEHVCGLFGSYC